LSVFLAQNKKVINMFKKYLYLLTGLALFLGCAIPGTEALAKSLSATKIEISLVDGIAVDKSAITI